MEFLFNEPEAFQRKSESEVLEALLVSLHGNESKANKLQMYNVSNCRKYIVILDYYEASFPCKLFPNSGQKLPRFTNTTDSLRMQTISKGRKEMDAEELKVSDWVIGFGANIELRNSILIISWKGGFNLFETILTRIP